MGKELLTHAFLRVPPAAAQNMLGNGLSTSPSTCGLRAAYPLVSIADNVALQRRLLRSLGVERVALAYGYSMGATQALTYAAMYPSEVRAPKRTQPPPAPLLSLAPRAAPSR